MTITLTLLTIGLISGTFTDIEMSFFQTKHALVMPTKSKIILLST